MIVGKAITAGGSGLNALVLEMLPEGYKRLEYIESAGTQWIDAGLRLNQDSKLEMRISHFDIEGNKKTFGSRTSATSNNFSVVSGPVGGTMSIVADFDNYTNNRLAYVINGEEALEISISKEKLKINDTEKVVTTYGEFETPNNAYLFNCSGTYPAGYSPASMRLYYCRIYQNNVLVRNFIPCKNDSAEVGLYDFFEGKFYGNAGSGSFIAGNEVPTLKGSGIGCVFTVSTAAGALVKAVLENTEVSGTANADGKVTFLLNKEGVWTVTATLDGETKSTEVLVEHNIEEELPFVDPVLQNNTWEEISEIARSGKASQIWNVGDTKQITVNGKTFNAQIIGFDHDNVTDSASYGREKAGITFQFEEIYSNNSWSNANPWHGSSLRTTTMADILSKMDDCKNYVVPVNKISMTAYNHASETIVSDSLFLLSEGEIFGTLTYCGITEGSQYSFYAAGNSKLKKFDGTVLTWWTRSGQHGTSSSYASKRVYVSTGGAVGLNDYSYSSGIVPAFCL